jgi:hypothetical protein
MKYIISFVFILACASPLQAARFKTKIHEIDPGQGLEPHLIKLSNGRVAFIEPDDENMIDSLKTNLSQGEMLEIELDGEQRIVSAQSLERFEAQALQSDSQERFLTYKTQQHLPSLLEDRTQVKDIFGRLNPNYDRDSQCYNRAHVWAYEEFSRNGLKSDKAFVFFSNHFIRRTNFWWWFHVAPLLTHKDGAWLEQRVLDHQFSKSPQRIQEWLGQWVKTGRPCEVVRKYSDYAEGQKSDTQINCYVIKTSMYFWQPRDIERYEKTGELKKQFIPEEIEHAYQEAFYGKRPADM